GFAASPAAGGVGTDAARRGWSFPRQFADGGRVRLDGVCPARAGGGARRESGLGCDDAGGALSHLAPDARAGRASAVFGLWFFRRPAGGIGEGRMVGSRGQSRAVVLFSEGGGGILCARKPVEGMAAGDHVADSVVGGALVAVDEGGVVAAELRGS